ncbi:hypothetical protein [Parasphingorhabdus sp.]|uniref:hypothetical protein n=1 Tax=Parasphingorhabdus sp. TaxID=2709688 RepID=UPI003A8E2865
MDIIAKAEAQREALKQEIDKLDNFLAIARELMGTSAPQTQTDVEPLRADVSHQIRKRAVRKPPKSGVIYETAQVAQQYMKEHGDGMKTRELLPIVRNKGIDVGGENHVATLSARLSTSMMFVLNKGRWYLQREAEEETADNPTKDTSADSLFNNQGDT